MVDKEIRKQLIAFLTTSQAHMTFLEAVKKFPMERINDYAPHLDYSPWDLLEHIRLTQRDLIEYMVNKKYKEPKWPEDYWPKNDRKASDEDWLRTIREYNEDVERLVKVVENVSLDISTKIPISDEHTYIREILMAIDHTAYHVGEFAILRQVMETWPKNHA